jgi:hypothetical protein
MELQLTFIPIQIWVEARNTHTKKNENTWSEYHTQHTITDSLSFTAAKKHGSFVA